MEEAHHDGYRTLSHNDSVQHVQMMRFFGELTCFVQQWTELSELLGGHALEGNWK